MEISLLKSLLGSIISFLELAHNGNIKSELVEKYHPKIEEILKLIKPIFYTVSDTEIASDEVFEKEIMGLQQAVDELRQRFENWHLLMSKIYFVFQVESLSEKVCSHCLKIFELLKSADQCLPPELNASSLELCVQKIKHMRSEQTSVLITKVVDGHLKVVEISSENLAQISDILSLKSNQELLIEAVALDKLKENAEQAENTNEVQNIDQMIALVTHLHDLLVLMKQSQTSYPVSIPPDFCCPLSLELMTDPVIVASGQTYERAFIREWIDLGLTVCPKTRHTLERTNLTPNYTVKALIAHWCESNNVKLPDPAKSINLNQSSLPHSNAESGGVPTVSPIKSPTQREGTSSSHPRSSSENFLAEASVNGNHLDMEIVSPSSEDKSDHSGERNLNLEHLRLTLPSSNDAAGSDASSSGVDNQTNSTLATNAITELNGNEMASQEYGSDASAELAAELQAATNSSVPQREPDLQYKLETRARGPAIWRRSSERFVPRVVPSHSVEMRADIVEVETEVKKLVEVLKSSSLDAQIQATEKIRLLAKHNMDNRIVIANCGVISLLVNLLYSTNSTVQENAVTALLNLSINDNNKITIANAGAIEPLIHVLQNGSPEAKENSAATLFSLSVIEDNKIKIGNSGAVIPLVDLLGNGTPRGKKDAATALFNLSINFENKSRVVQAGAVKYLIELMDPAFGMVDKAVAVLSNLSTIDEGRVSIGQEKGISSLVEVVELGSARGKENAAAALLQLCTNSNRFCNMVLQEGAVPPLVALSQSGTPRGREKAQQLLNYFRKRRHGNSRA